MDDKTDRAAAPAGWIEALDRSEAELAAGQTVPASDIREMLRAALARLEAKNSDAPKRRILPRR
jgi:hypothetical protein